MKKHRIGAFLSLLLIAFNGCKLNYAIIEPPQIDPTEFSESHKRHRVIFRDGDGTIMLNLELTEGESLAKYVETLNPTRPEDSNNTYTFSHWEPEPTTVTSDQVYTPKFDAHSKALFSLEENSSGNYTITKCNRSGEKIINIAAYEKEKNININKIGDNAFKGHHLEQIHLGAHITEIGKSAFEDCVLLNRVTYKTLDDDGETAITPSLTSIGEKAFANCIALKSIVPENSEVVGTTTLPSELTSIGTNAFEGCTDIKKIEIPSKVSYIGSKIFKSCLNLVDLSVSQNNTTYGSDSSNLIYKKSNGYIIEGCKTSKFTSTNIIGVNDDVFDAIEFFTPHPTDANVFNSVTSLTFPENLVYFGKGSFKNNLTLTSVTFSGTVKTFDVSTFEGCSNITNMVMNKTDGDFITSNNSVIRVKVSNGDTENVGSTSTSGDTTNYLELPRLIYGTVGTNQIDTRIKSVGKRAFYRSNVENIVFTHTKASTTGANDLVAIDDEAFRDCTQLQTLEIYFPGVAVQTSTMKLPLYMCRGCSSLQTFVIPPAFAGMKLDEVKGDNGSFIDCASLTDISIHSNLAYIYENTFTDCRSISKIRFSGDRSMWDLRKSNDNGVIRYKSRGNETVLDNGGVNAYEFNATAPFSTGVLLS